ncbi:MAG: 4-oxalocrotonate tautomerase family protein [Methylotenera sp.]|nr:4-oxalocrotonate tautomerase family protein [Methylotenera sp.]
MPLVQIKGIASYLNTVQKQDLIKRITDAVIAVEGEGARPVTWVIVEDVPSGTWGVGGQPITTEAFKQLVAQSS